MADVQDLGQMAALVERELATFPGLDRDNMDIPDAWRNYHAALLPLRTRLHEVGLRSRESGGAVTINTYGIRSSSTIGYESALRNWLRKARATLANGEVAP